LNPEPVTQNEALEPETPPQPATGDPAPLDTTGKDDPNQAFILTEREYEIMKPLYDRFKQQPELRHTIAKTLREFHDIYGYGFVA
jgi:hypothetical protein